jgi:capsular exopolysaccharide synthesis family protein
VSLASVLAAPNKRVLLIDADLRKPRVGKIFSQNDNVPGLTTLLTRDDVKLQKALHRSKVPGFYYMTAGPLPPNPAGLLESERMEELTSKLKQVFDLVIFDSPPIVGFSDSRILARNSDAVVLVVKESYIPADVVRQAKLMITSANAPLLGVVLNMAKATSSFYGLRYSRYYKYYDYYSTPSRSSKGLLSDNN